MGICIHGELLAGGPGRQYSSSECLTGGDLFVGLQGLLFLVLSKSCVSVGGCCGQLIDFWPPQCIGPVDVGTLL